MCSKVPKIFTNQGLDGVKIYLFFNNFYFQWPREDQAGVEEEEGLRQDGAQVQPEALY